MIKIDAHVQISVVTMHLAFPISEYSVFTYFAKNKSSSLLSYDHYVDVCTTLLFSKCQMKR